MSEALSRSGFHVTFPIILLTVLMSVGCTGSKKLRGVTVSPEDYGRYSVFFTPTHHFECGPPAIYSVQLVPGDVYGAVDFAGVQFSGPQGRELRSMTKSDLLPDGVIGLQLHEWPAYAIINPDGEFAVPNYPAAQYNPRTKVLWMSAGHAWKCTNKPGIAPFRQIDVKR